jgi:uncharacterized surface protein with fasciclin (FAS1) repeats
MKKLSFLINPSQLVLTAWLTLTALSCQKSENGVARPQTITDRIIEDDQFSILRAAVKHGGVGDALKGGNLTLFAPANAAFEASGLANEAAITALPKEQVRQIVLYHVLYSPVSSTLVPDGLNSTPTGNHGVAYINKTGNGTLYINNAKVIQSDIALTNGYIQIIDQVLMPSVGTLSTTIQNNPELTFLAAAIRRIGAANPALAGMLDGTTPASTLTMFAPSDAAFVADGRFVSLDAIETASPQTLSNMLLYHTVSGVVFSSQILTGTIRTMLNNSRLIVTVTPDGVTVKGIRNTLPASIQMPDITTTNGVIHVVDQVLLP